MKRTRDLLSCVALVVLLAACGSEDRRPVGQPTAIRAGETAVDTLCRMRAEFANLESPLLDEVVFHDETRVLQQVEFHLHRKHLDAYYEFKLKPHAQQFVDRHSRSELIAALLPLMMHPVVGGEVAVLLVGLPVRDRFDAHYHFARPSTMLEGMGYRSPSDRGRWSPANALSLMKAFTPIASDRVMYAPAGQHDWQTRGLFSEHTLEDRLYTLTNARRYLSSSSGRFRLNDASGADDVVGWLEANAPPPMADELQAILAQEGDAFAIHGLLPHGIPYALAIEALDLDQYWPLAEYAPGQGVSDWDPTGRPGNRSKLLVHEVDEYAADFARAYFQRIYEVSLTMCPDGPAMRQHVGMTATGSVHRELLETSIDSAALEEAIESARNLDARDANGRAPICTPVNRSAWRVLSDEHLNAASMLLAAGASPASRCGPAGSAAAEVVRTRNWALAKLLRRYGARLDDSESRSLSVGAALASAVASGDLAIAETLLELGVHPDARRPDQSTALEAAIVMQDQQMATLLLAHDANSRERAYLEQVVELEQERNDLLALLIISGAAVDATADNQNGPLHMAAVSGRVEQTRDLLAAGADPNLLGKSGKPLVILLQQLFEPQQSFPLIDMLLEAGADPTLPDSQGAVALTVAADRGDQRLAERLVAAGGSLDARTLNTALARAVSYRKPESAELLLSLGADANARGMQGMSLLEEAARRDAVDVAAALLDAGASPDTTVSSGTALLPAVSIGLSAWRYPANRSQDREPLPIVTAALLAGNVEMLERLIAHGADVNRPTASGLSPLLVLAAAAPGTVRIDAAIETILRAGTRLDLVDKEGYTALTRAASANQISLLARLGRAGIDLNAVDSEGRRVVEQLGAVTSNVGGLRELLSLGLQSTPHAVALAEARNARVIAQVLEAAL